MTLRSILINYFVSDKIHPLTEVFTKDDGYTSYDALICDFMVSVTQGETSLRRLPLP